MDTIAPPGAGHNSGLDPALDPDLLRTQWEMDNPQLLARQKELTAASATKRPGRPTPPA